MDQSHQHHSTRSERNEREFERASDFHAALLGIAAHDLRQPLQVIQSSYDWLSRNARSATDRTHVERGERAVATIAEQFDRLVDALRIYELSSSMSLSQVALGPFFETLSAEYRDYALEHGVCLRASETSAHVISNPVMLDSIVRNLVRNAIKYTRPGGSVLIGCRRRGPDVRVDVCDTGIGIAADQVPNAFKAFVRLGSNKCEGLGIGLFVVRRALELLGHRMEVNSIVDRGTRFSVYAKSAYE